SRRPDRSRRHPRGCLADLRAGAVGRAPGGGTGARGGVVHRLEPVGGERGGLVDHAVHGIQGVRDARRPRSGAVADGVAVGALVDGLGHIQRADDDRRRADVAHELVRRLAEQGDCGDVTGHLGWHRRGYQRSRHTLWYDRRSDESRHHCALRESAEHDPGLGTVSSRGLNVARRVPDPFDDRFGELDTAAEVAARRVVDRIHVDRSSAGLRAQRVDEGLAHAADPGRLAGPAREHHVDIWTRLGGRDRGGCAHQRRRSHDRDTSGCQETSGSATGHDSTPNTHLRRDDGRKLINTPMFVLGKHDPIPRVDGQWQRRLINVKAMAEAGFWVAWGLPTQGREKQALDLLNETRGYLERLAHDRRVGGDENAEPGERRHLGTDDASWSPSTTGTSRRCRRVRATVTAVSVVALLLSAPALAWADPEAPQPGTACSVDMSDVMTWPSDARMPLVCANGQ